jgi:hypothetical protein
MINSTVPACADGGIKKNNFMIYFILFTLLVGLIKSYLYTKKIKPEQVLPVRLKNYENIK